MKNKKIINLMVMALFLSIFTFNTVEAKINTTRLYGDDRYETMKRIFCKYSSDIVDTVILASGENFPDALSAGIISKKFNAPIILAPNNGTEDSLYYIQSFIEAHLNDNGKIIVLGGDSSVSNKFVSKLTNLEKVAGYECYDFKCIKNTLITNYKITRLGGKDRFETNSKIVEYAGIAKGTPIIIANGNAFPDALSISSISGIKGYPVLLTNQDKLSDFTIQQIKNIAPSHVYIVGGTGAVSDTVEDSIISITGLTTDAITRIYGSDRYETSLSIAKAFELDTDTVMLANGENFPDALAGSALAIKLNAPIILTDGKNVTKQMKFIDSKKYSNSIILGGYGAISKNVEDLLNPLSLEHLARVLPGVNPPGNKPAKGTPGKNNRNLSLDTGWVMPVLKSTSTDNIEEDAKILINELEFYENGETSSKYSPFGDMYDNCWTTWTGTLDPNKYWNSITFEGYSMPIYEPYMTKLEYINPQLLKFYFPTQWQNIHKIATTTGLKEGERYNWDGREVYIKKYEGGSQTVIMFSKKGGKLNIN